MKINKRLFIIPVLVFIDQISKIIALKTIPGEIIINNFISLNIIQNTGMALSLNSDNNIGNIFISILLIIIILRFLKNQKNNIDVKTEIVLYMILSGGFSNLIDRIFRGAVIDFISIGKFPIFNIADVFIVLGWILFIILLVIFSTKRISLKE